MNHNFYFLTTTHIIIKIDGIIEEVNIKNNSLCVQSILPEFPGMKGEFPLSSGGLASIFRLNFLPFRAVYYLK